MDSLKKLLRSKAGEIDIDAKREDIHLAKLELERFYSAKQVQIKKLEGDLLTVSVRSSTVASEIRLGQVKILEAISNSINKPLTRIHIKVGR